MTDNEMLGRLLTVDFIDEHGSPLNEFRKAVITRLAMLSRQIEDAIEELADVAVIDGGHHKQWGIARALEILGYHLTADIDGGIEP